MEITKLLRSEEEERAVSPVIGVILMVAITVILAAVIGTFVLGLGDTVQETAPNAQWSWDYASSENEVELSHEGGDSIDAGTLSIVGSGLGDGDVTDVTAEGSNSLQTGESFSDPVRAGQSVTLDTIDSGSGDIRVVWTSQSGDRSSTMSTFEVRA